MLSGMPNRLTLVFFACCSFQTESRMDFFEERYNACILHMELLKVQAGQMC